MNSKKNQSIDLKKDILVFRLIGLFAAFAFCFIAFSFKSSQKLHIQDPLVDDSSIVFVSDFIPPKLPKPEIKPKLNIPKTNSMRFKISNKPETDIFEPNPEPETKEPNNQSPPEEKFDDETVIFVNSEVPKFIGENGDFNQFCHIYLIYPEYARDNELEGHVEVSFVIHKDGSISEIQVLNNAIKDFKYSALQLIQKTNGLWKPYEMNGRKFNSRVKVTLTFELNN